MSQGMFLPKQNASKRQKTIRHSGAAPGAQENGLHPEPGTSASRTSSIRPHNPLPASASPLDHSDTLQSLVQLFVKLAEATKNRDAAENTLAQTERSITNFEAADGANTSAAHIVTLKDLRLVLKEQVAADRAQCEELETQITSITMTLAKGVSNLDTVMHQGKTVDTRAVDTATASQTDEHPSGDISHEHHWMYAPKGSVYSRGKVPPNTPGWLAGELSALRSAFANSMEAIDTLKNDRDKLKSQVETLQQQLSSFTRGPSGHRSSYGSTPGGQTIYQPPEDTSLGGATPAYTEAQTKEGWNVEVQETWGSGGTWGDASTMQSTNDAPTGRHTNEAAVADPTHAGARQATSSSHVASDSSRSHRRRSGGHKSAKGGQDIDANALADCDVDKVFVQQPKQLETIRNVAVKVCVSELKNFWSHYVEPGLIRRKAAVSHVQNLHKTLRDRVFKIEEHVNMKHPPEGPGEAIPDSATSEQPGSVASLQPLPLPAPPEQEASTGDTDMTATN